MCRGATGSRHPRYVTLFHNIVTLGWARQGLHTDPPTIGADLPRPREYDESTREALVEAAGRLLVAGGLDAVTTRAVAAEVGATTSAIYALFGSKTALLAAVHEEGFRGLDRSLRDVAVTQRPLADLRELALAYRRSARARPHLYQVMFGPPIAGLQPGEAGEQLAGTTLQRLVDTVARCQRAGVLAGDEPWPVTRQLWALVHGLASLELRGALGPDEDAQATWEQALRTAARGLAPDPDRPPTV